MNKSFVSILLVITMIGGIVLGAVKFDSNNVVMANGYNQGYSLEAEDMDSTGININSRFILKSEEAKDIQFVKQNLSISGDIKLQVEQKDSKTYFIKPENSLLKNKIYQFKLKLGNSEEVWNFQTMSDFNVLGTLPRNESTNVPINTGIEIDFTHEGTEEIAKYFEIEPKVEGEFEVHDRVAVFVPKELKEETIYKVTLKKGLRAKDSQQQLKEDYNFSFETKKKELDSEEEREKGNFYFSRNMNEFGAEEKQFIPYSYYIRNSKDNKLEDNIKVNIYAYKSVEHFIEGIQKINLVPQWARYNYNNRLVNVEELEKVVSFEQKLPDRNQSEKFIEIPQNLKSGYYVVEGLWENVRFQTFVQVTDIGVYQTRDKEKTLLWLNDIKTKKPINKASVNLSGTNLKWESNDEGIARFDTPDSDEQISYYIIKDIDGKSIVVTSGYNNELYGQENQNYDYWKYIKTDRNLYKPTDTVKFYGYIQNRYKEENIDSVKVELKENNYWGVGKYFPGNENSLDNIKLNIKNGFFEGEMKLPYLDNGNYNLTVKLKDEVILSTYITVEDYIKPAYKIEISKDKKAIFLDEPINFNIKSSFFEGTPVSNLDIDYNTYGITNNRGKLKTDIKGNAAVSITPKYVEGLQGRKSIYLSSYASLPESGRITGSESVDVYINDINVSTTGEIKDNKITLETQVNYIDLKPLNDEDKENDKDYIGAGVNNKKLTGEIYENVWKKKEVGQYYDFINKVVRKKYEYYTEQTKIKSFEIVTDEKGYGKLELEVVDLEGCYYTAKIKTKDSKDRAMNYSSYIRRSTSSNEKIDRGEIRRPEYDDYKLDGGKESYKLNEDVKLTFKNNEEVMPKGSYLFIQGQNGIKDINVQNSPIYKGAFEESDIPNVIIKGVYFNGKTYIETLPFNALYDFKQKEILLSAKTDKESYKPGEECTVTIKALSLDSKTNEFNKGQESIVNLSIVDEAIFRLQEEYLNTLEQLYQRLPSGINYSYISHGGNSDIVRFGGYSEKSMADGASNEMLKSAFSNNRSVENKVKVRSDFKDTALFKTVRLDENGEGKITFKLPDNVTSWRISMSAISSDLDAGSNKVNLKVSLPYFINQSINTTYLVGDKPYIGLTSYGEKLKEGEKITYEVTCLQKSDFKSTVTAKAFERINAPLWELEEGDYDLVVKSISESGLSDGVNLNIKVVNTYHQIQKAKHEKLLPNMNIEGGSKGITKLIFADDSISKYIYELYSYSYTSGNRVDQKVIAYSAKKLLKEKFEQDDLTVDDAKLSDYQTNIGAISLLPYSDNDLELSAKLISIVKDDMDISKIKAYLYGELYSKAGAGKAIALYGLAQVQEPVLLELEKEASIQNLTLKEYIYIALAYAELNEYNKANLIYEEKITPYIEDYEVDARVEIGSEDDNLYYTALTSILASKLNKENKEKLHNYARSNYSKEVLVKLENYLYILNEIEDKESQTAEFSYTYRGEEFNKEIKDSSIYTLKIPSVNLNDFNINSVDGNVALVTVFEEEMKDSIKEDNNLKVSRVFTKYYGEESNDNDKETKEFKQGDIVKVVINYDIKEDAIEDYYKITDYAPSGLKPIESSYNRAVKLYIPGYYRNIESGKVTFYVNKNNKEKQQLYYYARVITPGTYKAEGVIIQGTRNRDSLYISDQDTITIK